MKNFKNSRKNELSLALNKVTRFLFEFRNQNKRKRRKVKNRKLGKLEIMMGENPSFFYRPKS